MSELTSDIAHGERELESMRQAQVESDRLLADAEAGWKAARAEELKADINACYESVIENYKSASGAFDEVKKIVKEILGSSKRAREAHSELIRLVTRPEKDVIEWKVQGLKKPAAILMTAVNHYRSYFKIER